MNFVRLKIGTFEVGRDLRTKARERPAEFSKSYSSKQQMRHVGCKDEQVTCLTRTPCNSMCIANLSCSYRRACV